jgi:nicotinamide-nucleotide amidase
MIELLSIGNELLLGETTDTNASWIARRLAGEGIAVARVTTVGDDIAVIRDAMKDALHRTRTVLCTGGLGPTPDDLTRHALAEVYGSRIIVDEGWLEVLRERYARRGIPLPSANRVQAERPDGAVLLHNERGTAPGLAMDGPPGLTLVLPGVPHEMRALVDGQVLPLLHRRFPDATPIESRVLRTTGMSEALVAENVADLVPELAPLTLAFLPQITGVDLRLTAPGADAARQLDAGMARLRDRLGHHVYAEGEDDLAVVVGRMLRERGMTLALAESCTGGLVARRMTEEAGASDYLLAGFVTYSNDAKQAFLGVRPETLATHGAVSELCAREMAEGARRAIGADAGVAITGIAGPGGGSEDKPVGTVWLAVALPGGTAARHAVFPGDRAGIRARSAQAVLDLLRRSLQDSRDRAVG